MTIVEFLLARIAEDEAPVERSRRHNAEEVYANDNYGCLLVDPMRVLAECQAKRAIIAEHGGRPPFHVDPCDAHDVDMRTIPCDTLRHLAAVYADHPDYRDEWRP